MIREEDLREAIAECEGVRNPSSATCLKLASYYTILNQMRRNGTEPEREDSTGNYSFATSDEIPFSNTEFSRLLMEKGLARTFPVLDEMMSALYVVNQRMYDAIIRKLEDV